MRMSETIKGQAARPLALLVLTALCAAVGAAIATKPIAAWLITASVIGLTLLEVPPGMWTIGAILGACLVRVGVVLGLPSFLNFAHFPLAVAALLVLALKGTEMYDAGRKLRVGLVLLFVITMASWAINDGEPL